MAKKIIGIILILILVLSVAFLAVTMVLGFSDNMLELVRVEDIRIPDKIRESSFGLFFYNADGSYVRSTEPIESINFDVNKPIVIFTHGVQFENGYKNDEIFFEYARWLAAGYNVAEILWSQYSDDSPTTCEEKVWTRNSPKQFAYTENGERVFEKNDDINYSLAEIHVAYYLDFMNRVDYKGNTIHFQGHSLGANTTYAICSYLMSLEEAGLIGKEYLPDRVTFEDAFLSNDGESKYTIPWLNRTIDVDGTAKLAYETTLRLKDKGIATEYIKSTEYVGIAATMGSGDKTNYTKLREAAMYLDYNTAFSRNFIGLENFTPAHAAARDFYNEMKSEGTVSDYTDLSAGQLGVSPDTPIPYVYARMGTTYSMNDNTTEKNFSDDYQYGNAKQPKIAGFAFFDINKNGLCDDRLYSHMDGVTVTLCDKAGNEVASTVTKNGGYYEFLLETTKIGQTYYVKADLPSGYQFSTVKSGTTMLENSVGSSGRSAEVKLTSAIDLKLLHIGFTK